MSAPDDVRVIAMLAACEMALVRRDGVAGPLLQQAARAAAGRAEEPYIVAATHIARTVDLTDRAEANAAARKVTQALCRWAAQCSQEAALSAGRGDG